MLIVSRKEDEKVRFPDLGITVHILRVQGSKVRVGVDAPMEVRILRDELEVTSDSAESRIRVIRLPQEVRHELRNELNSFSIALHLFKKELEANREHDAEATFNKLVERLERVCENAIFSKEGAVAREDVLSVLLVEDQANEREMLAGLLRMHGWKVATAPDGLEALDYLANNDNDQPSVVLIDMRMPRCDGPTTIRRIRENPAFNRMKIFGISGLTAEENGFGADDSFIDRWFQKPLNPKHLFDALSSGRDC